MVQQGMLAFMLPDMGHPIINLLVMVQQLITSGLIFDTDVSRHLVDHSQPHAADPHDEIGAVVLHHRRPVDVGGVTDGHTVIMSHVIGQYFHNGTTGKQLMHHRLCDDLLIDPFGRLGGGIK